MSPILSSQGVVLATAMAAVSGTVILLALRHQKSFDLIPQQQQQRVLRSCISRERKKKNKKVHFAEDVVDPSGDGEEFRRRFIINRHGSSSSSSVTKFEKQSFNNGECNYNYREMPENRVALYNGIIRDRVVHQRFAYSF